jgi:hypothetical protein
VILVEKGAVHVVLRSSDLSLVTAPERLAYVLLEDLSVGAARDFGHEHDPLKVS